MPNFRKFLPLFLLYLCCAASVYAQQCVATITANPPRPVCQGEFVRLQANTGTGLTYQWFRKDTTVPGATAEPITNATADFLEANLSGEYTVQVSGPACTPNTSIPVTVTVNPLPVQPDFIFSPNTSQCSGEPVVFTIIDPVPGESYVWDFGDGIPTIGDTVTHTYQLTGGTIENLEVKVYSRNAAGCRSPIRSQFVSVKQTPAFTAPTDSAGFNVCLPDSVSADSISVKAVLYNTAPVPADIASYLVDFGDGSGEQSFLPEQFTDTTPISNPTPYDTTGAFTITIRALGINGCETVFTRDYQINKKPEAKFSAQKDPVSPPVGDKTCVPVKVTVDSDSTSGGNVTYKWSVKNNTGQNAGPSAYRYIESTTDTSANPILQFSTPGRYNLELIATNSCGSDTLSQSLLIGYPEVRFNADSTSCGPIIVNFNDALVTIDENLGTKISYQWEVTGTGGAKAVDGTSLKQKNPKISFPNPGTYKVTLVATNECGPSNFDGQTAEATITVNALPNAPVLVSTGITLCAGDTTSIRPTGPGSNFAFYASATVATPFFTGPAYNPGALPATTTYYVATLDAKGCVSTERKPFTITMVEAIANNTINQTQEQTEVCAGQTISRALTGPVPTGGSGSPRYQWQSSLTGNAPDFVPAAGRNTSRTYTPPPLSATTWYRRVVTIGDCQPDTSNVVRIQVNPAITNNTINVVGGSSAVTCEGEEGPEITGSAPTGSNAVIVYESSTTSGTATDFSPAPGVNNEANYSPGLLTETTWFRRRIISGGCESVSPVVEITVNRRVTNNSITESQDICSTTTIPDMLIGSIPRWGGGTLVYLWESSLTGNDDDFGPAPGTNNQSNYTPPAISQTTWFRRSVIAGSCAPVRSNEVRLTFVPPIENNIITASQTTVCEGGLPTLRGSSGSGGVAFLWESSTTSATTGFNPAPGTNDGAEYTPPGLNQTTWYRRTVRPTNAECPPTPSNVIEITIEPLPEAPTVEAAAVTVCQGNSATLRAIGNGHTYEWYTTPTFGSPVFYGQEFLTPRLTGNTTYYVQAVSANQCVSPTRTPVTVSVTEIFADAGRDTTIIEGETIALLAKGGTQYQWSPAAGLNNTDIANPVAAPTKTTTYQVRVSNELGCEATDEVTITVIPRVRLVNTFSPNQDGINETWEIANIENFPEATVEIFNRWGNPVFKSSGPYQPWDGTFNGSPLPLATYYYIIYLEKDAKPISGSVTLIR